MSVERLSVPRGDPVANRLVALADGTGRAERVLRRRLAKPASPRPHDYLFCVRQGELALTIAVNNLTAVVRHIDTGPWERVNERDGVIETGISECREHALRQMLDWHATSPRVVKADAVAALFTEADNSGRGL